MKPETLQEKVKRQQMILDKLNKYQANKNTKTTKGK